MLSVWTVNVMGASLLLLAAGSHGPDEEEAGGRGKVQREDRGWTARGKASKHASVLGLMGFQATG